MIKGKVYPMKKAPMTRSPFHGPNALINGKTIFISYSKDMQKPLNGKEKKGSSEREDSRINDYDGKESQILRQEAPSDDSDGAPFISIWPWVTYVDRSSCFSYLLLSKKRENGEIS